MISIIVPIYKVEKYISRCIENILSQTLSDWELLLIDDGSPDESGNICDKYAEKDSRIKTIHKKNEGVSSARNCGLEHACRQYITFVDADDWLDKECLDTCMKQMTENDLDIIQFGFKRVNNEGKIISKKILGTPISQLEQYINIGSYSICAWGTIYKREIIERYNIRFPLGQKIAEDQMFVFEYFIHATRLQSIPQPFYNYLWNTDSVSLSASSYDILDTVGMFERIKDLHKCFHPHANRAMAGNIKVLLMKHDISASDFNKKYYSRLDPKYDFKFSAIYRKLYNICPWLAYHTLGRVFGMYFKYVFLKTKSKFSV